MLNFNSILLGTDNPQRLAEFYEKVLDKKPDMVEEGGWYGFSIGNCFMNIGFHDKVKGESKNPERIIFNFETTDVEGEFERIEKTGATVIAKPYTVGEGNNVATIATFADPDSNYFQLVTPWNQ